MLPVHFEINSKKTNNPNPPPTGKIWSGLSGFGAADRARTGTVLPPTDFKSVASAYSATAAFCEYILRKSKGILESTGAVSRISHSGKPYAARVSVRNAVCGEWDFKSSAAACSATPARRPEYLTIDFLPRQAEILGRRGNGRKFCIFRRYYHRNY